MDEAASRLGSGLRVSDTYPPARNRYAFPFRMSRVNQVRTRQ